MKTKVRSLLRSTGRFLSPLRRGMRLPIPLAALIASVGLTGCGPTRLRIDYTHYENSYANTSNREVLLNLARLTQHDPTYFFQLGQISSTYQMQAGLSGTGSFVPQGTSNVEMPTGGGTPTAAYQNYSAFNFIPVSSEANAQLLLTTIPEDEFYNLYQQGWRVDQLFRLLVDRIEITLPPDADHPNQKGCRVEVIRNVPPPRYYAPDYAESERNLTRYVTFLRVSAIVYELQKHGLLQIGGTSGFSPLDKKSGLDGQQRLTAKDIVDAATNSEVWEWNPAKDDDPAKVNVQGKGKDRGQGQEQGKWLLGKKVQHPRFVLSSLPSETESGDQDAQGSPPAAEKSYGDNVAAQEAFLDDLFKKDKSLLEFTPTLGNFPGMPGYDPKQPSSPGAPELTDILEILYRGFAIGGTPTETSGDADSGTGACSPPQASSPGSTANESSAANSTRPVSSRLVMRSLLGVMAAAAQEQEAFDTLMKVNPDVHMELSEASSPGLMCTIHNDLDAGSSDNAGSSTPGGQLGIGALCAKFKGQTNPTFKFNEMVPAIEQLPVLRLTWPKDVAPGPAQDAAALMRYGLAVNYRGANYWITDFRVPDGDSKHEKSESASEAPVWAEENQSWNRDVFRLTTELSSQLNVDISKFPLPAVLQLPIE